MRGIYVASVWRSKWIKFKNNTCLSTLCSQAVLARVSVSFRERENRSKAQKALQIPARAAHRCTRDRLSPVDKFGVEGEREREREKASLIEFHFRLKQYLLLFLFYFCTRDSKRSIWRIFLSTWWMFVSILNIFLFSLNVFPLQLSPNSENSFNK